ncbi:hypothetical protein [Psychrobacillus vulpis]|uniref:hypothetical protein n=1 Tax=Psychrobacillus vulpis TaxID=2325572 RepID=UPI0014073BC5|nr:hypothetical protein [Psychrobacillus vulpis]
MLGIFLLIFVLILMILFAVASFLVSKRQKEQFDLDDFHKSIMNPLDHSVKPPK